MIINPLSDINSAVHPFPNMTTASFKHALLTLYRITSYNVCYTKLLRGNVIPVVDTRMKFDLDTYEEGEKFVIMILNLKLNNGEHMRNNFV